MQKAQATAPSAGPPPHTPPTRDPRRRRFELHRDAPPLALPAPLAPGPLRPAASHAAERPAPLPPAALLRSLDELGVLSLQVRHRGRGSEVRLRLQHPDGIVEASLRQGRGAGLEIHLTGDADTEPLLARIAETLTQPDPHRRFDLEEVSVGSGSLADRDGSERREHRRPSPTPDPRSGRRPRAVAASITARPGQLGRADYVT